nr:MAG TPA: hypothetical protein [Bacteriophage sp.]
MGDLAVRAGTEAHHPFENLVRNSSNLLRCRRERQ